MLRAIRFWLKHVESASQAGTINFSRTAVRLCLEEVLPSKSMNLTAHSGMFHFRSSYTHAETLGRLEAAVRDKGIRIFCRIDHGGEAANVGLLMNPAVVLIFGNPAAGTPLMVESPTLALDLPLKALVWQDAEGAVWVTGNSGEYLRQRHNLTSHALALAAVEQILAQVAGSPPPNN